MDAGSDLSLKRRHLFRSACGSHAGNLIAIGELMHHRSHNRLHASVMVSLLKPLRPEQWCSDLRLQRHIKGQCVHAALNSAAAVAALAPACSNGDSGNQPRTGDKRNPDPAGRTRMTMLMMYLIAVMVMTTMLSVVLVMATIKRVMAMKRNKNAKLKHM